MKRNELFKGLALILNYIKKLPSDKATPAFGQGLIYETIETSYKDTKSLIIIKELFGQYIIKKFVNNSPVFIANIDTDMKDSELLVKDIYALLYEKK